MAEPMPVTGKFLKGFKAPRENAKLPPFVMVIIGGAGDLSKRKLLPMLYHLYHEEGRLRDFNLISAGLPRYSDEEYRSLVRDALKNFTEGAYSEKSCASFLKRLSYVPGDLDDSYFYKKLFDRLTRETKGGTGKTDVLFYLAIPPGLLPGVIGRLGPLNSKRWKTKIIVEKPFGTDQASADRLNKQLLETFQEKQIFRIDHYLGKDTVQNMLYFRFGNSIFEPLWNRNFIDHVQITVAEDIGIENRGHFYEKAGVVRDIVQNHMMQLVALTAMEPPAGFDANLIRNEKVKVFRAIRRPDARHLDKFSVFGQYGSGKGANGYRREAGVSRGSITPTYFCGKFLLDNWRWAGVPFYVRTGKRLKRKLSRIFIQFKRPPLSFFGETYGKIEPNALMVDIQPQETICMFLNVKYPWVSDELSTVKMNFNYAESFSLKYHPAYERVLIDCINGDLTLFVRQDEIKATWGIVDPITRHWENKKKVPFPNYKAGAWGPAEADRMIAKDGRAWWNL